MLESKYSLILNTVATILRRIYDKLGSEEPPNDFGAKHEHPADVFTPRYGEGGGSGKPPAQVRGLNIFELIMDSTTTQLSS